MFARTATKMGKALEVHHIIPLEWAHLMGKGFNPNVIDNLVGVKNSIHWTITREWADWKRRLDAQGIKITKDMILKQAGIITIEYRREKRL
jgi:hypothetical protein